VVPPAQPTPNAAGVDGREKPDGGHVGERRRTPDSRQMTRER
jgi:hypothetical protein